MKIAPGLTLIAIGAIFTFAITSSPSWLNLQIVGVILMGTGVAGIFLPQRTRDRLRRGFWSGAVPEGPSSARLTRPSLHTSRSTRGPPPTATSSPGSHWSGR